MRRAGAAADMEENFFHGYNSFRTKSKKSIDVNFWYTPLFSGNNIYLTVIFLHNFFKRNNKIKAKYRILPTAAGYRPSIPITEATPYFSCNGKAPVGSSGFFYILLPKTNDRQTT
jgi:hypothetical protein